ncbi:polyphenol oxidase family protein, partial [bacterium]|nr:polyphenol oxidase family protein [bacterium]
SADVAGAAIDALDALGARPENLVAAIGPGIGPCCFEVGRDLAGMFRDEVPGGAHAVYDDGTRLTIDLAGIAYRSLIAHGLAAGRVTIVRRCTACEPRAFFSHRRDKGVTGRQIAAVLRAGAKP